MRPHQLQVLTEMMETHINSLATLIISMPHAHDTPDGQALYVELTDPQALPQRKRLYVDGYVEGYYSADLHTAEIMREDIEVLQGAVAQLKGLLSQG